MSFENEVSPYWRLADTLTIVQATLLTIGIEPQGTDDNIEFWNDGDKPPHYRAVRDSLVSALQSKALDGDVQFNNPDYNAFGFPGKAYVCDQIDFKRSTVSVTSLIDWLDARGLKPAALTKPKDEPRGFRDPAHPRYSNKLAAVVEAWEQFDSNSGEVGTPKQRLMKWLRLNASRFGLTDDDGKPSENVIEELAKVANWATSGGAPKNRGQEPDQ